MKRFILLVFCSLILASCGKTPQQKASDYLQEYEKFVDSYISVLKKSMVGDITAINDAQKMLIRYQDIQKKAEEIKAKLSDSEKTKFDGEMAIITIKVVHVSSGLDLKNLQNSINSLTNILGGN